MFCFANFEAINDTTGIARAKNRHSNRLLRRFNFFLLDRYYHRVVVGCKFCIFPITIWPNVYQFIIYSTLKWYYHDVNLKINCIRNKITYLYYTIYDDITGVSEKVLKIEIYSALEDRMKKLQRKSRIKNLHWVQSKNFQCFFLRCPLFHSELGWSRFFDSLAPTFDEFLKQ